MWAVIKKEFKSIFYSPMGYIILAAFLILFGAITYVYCVSNKVVDFNMVYYGLAIYGLPIIVAVLTMRSFSEEKSKDTEQLLMMSPRSTISIVLGKVLAILAVIVIGLALSLISFFVFKSYGNPSFKLILISMFGFILLSMACIAFGVFISCLTENQIISAVVTMVYLYVTMLLKGTVFESLWPGVFFEKLHLGVISFSHIIGLILFITTSVGLTVFTIKRRKMLR